MTDRELALLAADKIIESSPRTPLMCISKFDWVDGVGMYGLLRVAQKYNVKKYTDFLNNWITEHADEADMITTVNATAPMMTICDLAWERQKELCLKAGEYIMEKAPRTAAGGFEHTVTENVVFNEQMWADTLFMACLFLAKLGLRTGDKQYTDEAAKQLCIHYKYLHDDKTNLFFHGYSCAAKNNLSGIRWARANGWITASTVEFLEMLPEDFAGRADIQKMLNLQIEALARYQRKNGMFGTVIDDPEAYDETSATAAFAYGITRGVKKGYVDKGFLDIAKAAAKGVRAKIAPDGTVLGVSGGTPIMANAEEYKAIEVLPTLYGQALVMLMLTETDGFIE